MGESRSNQPLTTRRPVDRAFSGFSSLECRLFAEEACSECGELCDHVADVWRVAGCALVTELHACGKVSGQTSRAESLHIPVLRLSGLCTEMGPDQPRGKGHT